jgi:hypothetical protein
MSLVKNLKKVADAHQIEYKKNSGEAKMRELLGTAGVDVDLELAQLEVDEEEVAPKKEEPPKKEVKVGPTSPKKGREADNVAELKGKEEDLFFLGNCVKTGKPLYKNLKK